MPSPDLDLLRLGPTIFLVLGDHGGKFPCGHAFLILDEVTALIDSGCGRMVLEKIKARWRIDLLLNSHRHGDHTSGNGFLPEARLLVPQAAWDSLGRLDLIARSFGFPEAFIPPWKRFVAAVMDFQERAPDGTYAPDQVLDFGRLRLRAIATPGHTKDHHCFFDEGSGLLLAMDIDLTPFGPWYGHPESDLDQFKASTRSLQALRPKVVATSHRLPVRDDIDAKFERFLAAFDQRQVKIERLLAEGLSLAEIVEQSPIYGGHPYEPWLLKYFEGMMVAKHVAGI